MVAADHSRVGDSTAVEVAELWVGEQILAGEADNVQTSSLRSDCMAFAHAPATDEEHCSRRGNVDMHSAPAVLRRPQDS